MDIQQLTHDYLAKTITDDGFASLVAHLRKNENGREMFLRQVAFHGQIASHFKAHERNQFWGDSSTFERVNASDSPEEVDAEFEALLKASDTRLHGENLDHVPGPLSFRQALSLTGFVMKEVARKPQVVKGAVSLAAVLLLAVTLYFVFAGDAAAPNAPLAEQGAGDALQPNTPDTSAPSVVATLTAEHNAVWAEGASAPGSHQPGSKLNPGTRLTLTQGFAEITTHRGAIAILEAPATVELLDHNNAIRLHTGKLVGVCETESSKGFVVHTPEMDVTDLGTRFGVEARGDTTSVHVFTGAVEARHADEIDRAGTKTLIAGQSARATAGRTVVSTIDHDPAGFEGVLSQLSSPIEKWLEDPALIAAYLVGEAEPSQQTLINHAPRTANAMYGEIKGQPQWIDGPRPGTHAMRFNWADQTHVVLPDWPEHAPSEQATFSLWLRTTNAQTQTNTVLSQWDRDWPELPQGATRQDRINLTVVNNTQGETPYIPPGRSRLCLQFYDQDNDRPVLLDQKRTGGNLTPEDGWVHIAVTMHRQEGVTLYLNGEPIDASPGPLSGPFLGDSLLPLVIGGKPAGTMYFNGDIAELLILGRALSAVDVSDLYRSTSLLIKGTD